jgi:zinc D-Ala-D-Ala carboxypeptidase
MSQTFTLDQMIFSKTAQERRISNIPPTNDINRAMLFTIAGLERISHMLNEPMEILSGYRCFELNKVVGGSINSQHMKGEACDFIAPLFGDSRAIASFLEGFMGQLGIDQMILEKTWVHVSFTLNPRKQILTCRDGKYFPGIA